MLTALLMLADTRFPSGGHAHSGGLEPAAAAGLLPDEAALRTFLAGRLATAGLTAAGLARVACAVADAWPRRGSTARAQSLQTLRGVDRGAAGVQGLGTFRGVGRGVAGVHGLVTLRGVRGGAAGVRGREAIPPGGGHTVVPSPEGFSAWRTGWTTAASPASCTDLGWPELDAEADARTPSAAQRETSRRQGRTLLRAGRTAWPASYLDELAAIPGGPHHPIVLGAVAASAGCTPREAALAAAYLSVSGPASAAVRLLGLDPLAVNAEVARLASRVEKAADAAVRDHLPCPSAPGLDLLAEVHARSEARLFES